MAEGILAEPVPEQCETNFEPDFDEGEYQKWIGTFQDIPENIIEQLAKNKQRNEHIGATYVGNREKYGKTIIFADRWFQCETISKYLEKRGVRAGSVYSHDIKGVSKKTADENNKRVLEDFKSGKLDVILNVRMLTEGTDVPDAETAFITRQTTSRNLMTQMVGRALRGPKFGGTEKAYLVFFNDNWRQLINWAEYEMPGGDTGDGVTEYGKRPPLQYISIELVRKLAMQMDSGCNVNATPFLQLLPSGWYLVDYTAQLNGTDNLEPIKRLVMVFDHEEDGYKNLVDRKLHHIPEELEEEAVQFEKVRDLIGGLRTQFFPDPASHFGSNLDQDIFSILRHMAQNNSKPKFFPFEDRKNHDLDLIAEMHIAKDTGPTKLNKELQIEYNRDDRYWKVLYPSYDHFKHHYDGCENRILNPLIPEPPWPPGPEARPHVLEDIKRKVKERDGNKCLCCGMENKRYLQVDHIDPKYYGGSDDPENLQTLCSRCNSKKGTDTINFRNHETKLEIPPKSLPEFNMPEGAQANNIDSWKEFISKTVNFFYNCGAVQDVVIHDVGYYDYTWQVRLHPGNDPNWLEPHLTELAKHIRNSRRSFTRRSPSKIIALPRTKSKSHSVEPVPPNWTEKILTGKAEIEEEMKFVGSKDSNKYHHPSCGWAERIPSEDRIWFSTSEAAKKGGYFPCRVCKPNKKGKRDRR